MVTPTTSVRISREHHQLIHDLVRAIKSDPSIADRVRAVLAGRDTAAQSGDTALQAGIIARLEALEARLKVLEDRPSLYCLQHTNRVIRNHGLQAASGRYRSPMTSAGLCGTCMPPATPRRRLRLRSASGQAPSARSSTSLCRIQPRHEGCHPAGWWPSWRRVLGTRMDAQHPTCASNPHDRKHLIHNSFPEHHAAVQRQYLARGSSWRKY
jgi:hypothetical protein